MSTHLTGYLVKRLTGRPWVADFRDPWQPEEKYGGAISTAVEKWLRDRVIGRADRIICNTNAAKRYFLEFYPGIPDERFEVVPNGFDPEDFTLDTPSPQCNPSRFTITHTGEFYAGRNPLPLLQVIAELIREGVIPKEEIRIVFVGRDIRIGDVGLQAYLADLGLETVVQLPGQVSHHEAIHHMRASEVLFLIHPDSIWGRTSVPAKFYEYLAARRFILAVAPRGAVWEVVEGTRSGVLVEPDDRFGLKNAVAELYRRFNKGDLGSQADTEELRRFAYGVLGASVSAMLSQVCAEAKRGK
jgi:glycosyltransferase involved in cell wall biosynthesis